MIRWFVERLVLVALAALSGCSNSGGGAGSRAATPPGTDAMARARAKTMADQARIAAIAMGIDLVAFVARGQARLAEEQIWVRTGPAIQGFEDGLLSPQFADSQRMDLALALDGALTGRVPPRAFEQRAAAYARDPAGWKSTREAWRAFEIDLASGDPAAALARLPLPIPGEDPAAGYAIESRILEAEARSLAGECELARDQLVTEAGNAFVSGWILLSSRAWCGAAEAALRLGERESAEFALTKAIETEHGVAIAGRPRIDPSFYERILTLLTDREWLPPELEWLARSAELPLLAEVEHGWRDERSAVVVELAIANAHLDRHDGRAALLASRRAADRARTSLGRALAEVMAARSLVLLSRFGEARGVLEPVVEDAPPMARSAALAVLGAIELAEGRPERAATSLRSALDIEGRPLEFPGRASAEANFGIALLSTARVEEGLSRLRIAEARFRASLDYAQWFQVLENHLAAVRALGDGDEALRVQERLESEFR